MGNVIRTFLTIDGFFFIFHAFYICTFISLDNSKETDTGYSYGEQINLLESATFDLLVVQDLSDDWSDTQSIAESVYSTLSDASTLDSLSTSTFSRRTRKRKVRNKTKTIRQKKFPAKEQSSNLTNGFCFISDFSFPCSS